MALPNEKIRDVFIEEEMKDSYLTYSMSVIISRALPDVRDGLKPSQRRILVAMNDLNLGPRSKFRKCAKIVGDCSGNYHPHGDQVIYPTLARLAQDFSMRYPLADGQGNFGSIDGDPPAAMRYTEARMTSAAMEMLDDLERDAVDFSPNYDETRQEPVVLPGKFPNLLTNGSSGIAVGMATSIPPHNLGEICDAVIHLLEHPECSIDSLAKIVQGPDFPTGGLVCGRAGILEGYRTGRSTITLRARVHTETKKDGRKSLVVTEIPYQLSKAALIERVADLVKSDTLPGVSDIRDESDREGMRIVVELRRGEEDSVVLNQLYEHTGFQSTVSVNMIALVNARPRLLNLKEILEAYVSHRAEVIRRRTRFLLDRALERAHILEGLLIALDHIDAVIETIRASSDVPTARDRLVERFKLSEKQAQAILDMRLQRLTGLERDKIQSEYASVQDEIRSYRQILADERLVRDMIREDCFELKERYADHRRTEIVAEVGEFHIEDLVADETVAVTVSHDGYVKRIPIDTYRRQGRGGTGITGAGTKEGDFLEHLFIASTHDYILNITDHGRLHWLKVYDIPQLGRASRGRSVANLLSLETSEKVCAFLAVRNFDERFLVSVTDKGTIKKTELSAYARPQRGGIIAMVLNEDELVIGARITAGGDRLVIGTAKGCAIRFKETDVRPMGRAAHGVRGVKLREGDRVVDFAVESPGSTLLTVCQNGFGKRTTCDAYRLTRRGGSGVINIRVTEKNGEVVGLLDVLDDDEIMLISSGGMIVRIAVASIRPIGRATQGVRLIRLKGNQRLVAIAKVVSREEETPEGAPPPAQTPAAAATPAEEEAPVDETPEDAAADEPAHAGPDPDAEGSP
ncbi:MAG: DNA gyrase subunit A [Planctomycetota bacterium]